ncbi:MAG: ADP-glyceromanno-heptose 6-epimerase [Bacteroidota bacterium]
MGKESYIIVTGAAGFIGSYMVGYLNNKGYENLILVDEFPARPAGGDEEEKELNLHGKKYWVRVERENLFEWLNIENPKVDFVFHLGARTDTTEFDYSIHEKLNVEYSKKIWEYCAQKNLPAGRQGIPLVYASSAATYGGGELGYKDDHDIVEKLQPLNAYGISKNEFDKWAIKKSQESAPPFWAGLKFFNVYGPNEYHKGRMASVVLHAFNQIQKTGKVRLFKSHKPEFKDGEQLRDFIYVEDVVAVCYWIMEESSRLPTPGSRLTSGLYNLGTGIARSFKDLVTAIFDSLKLQPNIEYIDTPEDIRDKYQYFTQADMNKLHQAGYTRDFYSLEDGVKNYVANFLVEKKYY